MINLGSKSKIQFIEFCSAKEERVADLAAAPVMMDGDGGFHFIEMRWASVGEAGFFLPAEALRTDEFTEKRK